MELHFGIFRISLFEKSQRNTFAISAFNFEVRVSMHLSEATMLVSSVSRCEHGNELKHQANH